MTDPIVELQSGCIRGLVEKHEDGFDYYAFKGIPYAEPPLGDLRFEDPIPIKKWSGTLDCKSYGPACLQNDFYTGISSYDENCLHLNVYTRAVNKPHERKAVIVIGLAGNFAMGFSSDIYFGPDYLIRKDVVLVTISSRLGVLGFLNLEDPIAPGNQGLKDQVMALRWVQQNIEKFSGDPTNVTFGGHVSAGASAVYLATSPLAKGLIHKILCGEAVVYNPWTTIKTPLQNAIELCSLLGKKLKEPKDIKDFLKTVDTSALYDACESLWMKLDNKPFGPGIDDKSPNPVVPIDRYEAADKGIHLPALVGHNSREGIRFLLDFEKFIRYNAKDILDRYKLSPLQVRRLYYKGEVVSENNIDNYIEYSTDVYFQMSIHRFVRVQAEKSSAPTYMYVFNFESPDKLSNAFFDRKIEGTCTGDSLPFLFKVGLIDQLKLNHFTKGTKSYRIMDQMTEMWSNFAKYRRPTIELSELIPVHWKPISDGRLLRYMNIDEDLTMQYGVNLEEKWLSAQQIKA